MPWGMFEPMRFMTQFKCQPIPDPCWRPPPANRSECGDDIHIWRASLELPELLLGKLSSYLSRDEEERSSRYKFQVDKDRFVGARGILRAILSPYVDADPRSVEFEYGNHGKPAVKRAGLELRFNVAHSHDLALYAIASKREIGVDVEHVRSVTDADEIVERYFTSAENAVYRALSKNQRPEAFFRIWTLKEAYLKALGSGLTQRPLNSFEISLPETRPPGTPQLERISRRNGSWSFYTLTPRRGYVAAVAVDGPIRSIRFWDWSPNNF